MMKKRYSKYEVIFFILIGIVTFMIGAWTIRDDFYFLFDDIAWLKEVKFNFDVTEFFQILPTSRYNDRPLRTFFFWCIYQMFGLNYTAYYLIVLLWHVVDTYLVLILTFNILELIDKRKENVTKSYICALFFGIYPKNLMAVYWIAGAANDLLCTFFSLLTMLCYSFYMKNRKAYMAIIGALVFYVCAMRSKEAAICLPLIILIFEYYNSVVKNEKRKVYIGNIILLCYMVIYLVTLLRLPAGLTTDGQYKWDFSPLTIIKVLLNYIRMYFGLDDGSFSYQINDYYTKLGNVGVVICAIIFSILIARLLLKRDVKKNFGFLLIGIAVGLSMAPLLVLPNIQHLLYFYFPAVFLSMFFGLILYDVATSIFKWKYAGKVTLCALLVLLIWVNNIGGAKRIRESFIHWGEEALSTVKDIEYIEKVPANTTVYLYGANTGANVFNYSPGYIVNILYEDDTIKTILADEATTYKKPYVVWYYSNGHVQEIERMVECDE